jgi:hypothetical protein
MLEPGANPLQLPPLGVFHAVRTRDAVGLARDGWPYFVKHRRGFDTEGQVIFEIQFGDGQWMLAVDEDLRDQP